MNRKTILAAAIMVLALSVGCPGFTSQACAAVASADDLVTVAGTVSDVSGEALIGATVKAEHGTAAAVTDMDGHFSLRVARGTRLVVSYLGYGSQTIAASASPLTVKLAEDRATLDEVVVVGYGSQKKETLTGAVTVVGSKMLEGKGNLSNPAQALQGQVPGVVITRTSSAPGQEGWNMKLRGSFSRNNSAALVIIDGVESDDFSQLNPADIESINFLKDASAAIYGSKAAGGVIIVTTKHAKDGRVKVEYSGSVTAKFVGLQPELMNLTEWCDALEAARLNDGKKPADDQWLQYIALARQNKGHYINCANSGNPFPSAFQGLYDFVFFDTDWEDILWGTAVSTSHELSVSGGGDKATYRLSARYMSDGSNLLWGNNHSERYNVRLNNNFKFTKRFTLDSNIYYYVNNTVSPTQISKALTAGSAQPGFPASTIDGKPYAWGNWATPNWVCELGGDNKLRGWGISIGETLKYNISKSLDATATFGYSHSTSVRDVKSLRANFYDYTGTQLETRVEPTQADTYYVKSTGLNNLFTANVFANWHRSFGDHNLAAMAGMQYSYKDYDYSPTMVKDIMPSLDVINGVGTITLKNESGAGPSAWQESQTSGFARLNYNWASRYLVEFNFRYDGSSKFRSAGRWAPFYGVSAGWRMAEEKFMKWSKPWLDDLKLRASYGTVGNQGGIDRYDGLQLYNFTQNGGAYIGDGKLSVVDTNGKLISNNRKWETVKNYNLGIDIVALNSRLRATGELFWKQCDNMLIAINTPATLGDAAPTANLGAFRANGWEGQVSWTDRIGKVEYTVGGTVTYTTNTLKNNGGDAAIKPGVVSNREGYPLNSVFGMRYCGKIQTQEQLDKYVERYAGADNSINMPSSLRLGDNMYEDVNGDGKLTEADYVYLGTDDPKLSYSFNGSLTWHGLTLSFVFQGAGRRTIWRGGDNNRKGANDNWRIPMMSWYNNTTHQSVGNVWSPGTPDARYPTYTDQTQVNLYNYMCSSWSVENGSYLRLKNVSISYALPAALLAKTRFLTSASVYVTGTDLWESSSRLRRLGP